jgi:galactose mutarotase-like enzyme
MLQGDAAIAEATALAAASSPALEPRQFPDSPNHANFPSARVDPGKPYRAVMIHRVSVDR